MEAFLLFFEKILNKKASLVLNDAFVKICY